MYDHLNPTCVCPYLAMSRYPVSQSRPLQTTNLLHSIATCTLSNRAKHMNTTPNFDQISKEMPIESLLKLRFFALLRIGFIVLILASCVYRDVGISTPMDILTGLCLGAAIFVGTGWTADGTEQFDHAVS